MTSQSPSTETLTLDYSDSWAAVNRMIREGQSWSGRERHVALMNVGGGSFVDASQTMGLGFADDGRCFVAMDWDGDGDQDLWIKNRTAPQLRFMRNDGAEGSHVRLLLRDAGHNSAAIGARVELRAGGKLLVRERQAGAEFLAQTSPWLHFGLGATKTVESLNVRWPDGEREDFEVPVLDGSYVLQRGSGRPQARVKRESAVQLLPSEVQLPRQNGNTRVALTQPVSLPALEIETLTGSRRKLGTSDGAKRPLLVTFWASWCPNCVRELRAWGSERERFKQAGIELLALSVDEEESEALALWQNLELPFASGLASSRVISLFDLLQRICVDRQREMAVPTSFLLDAEGRIAFIYRGPMDGSTVIRDAESLSREAAAFAGAPFPGRALGAAMGLRKFAIARRLLDRDAPEDALFYLQAALRELGPRATSHPDAAPVADALMRTGLAFMDRGELPRAWEVLEQAAALDPNDAVIRFALAKLHAVRKDNPRAIEACLQALRSDPKFAAGWNLLGTLRFVSNDPAAAIAAYEKALEAQPELFSAWSGLGIAYLTTEQFEAGRRAFARAVALDSQVEDCWFGLGYCLIKTGRVEPGVEALERALAIDPESSRALAVLKALGKR